MAKRRLAKAGRRFWFLGGEVVNAIQKNRRILLHNEALNFQTPLFVIGELLEKRIGANELAQLRQLIKKLSLFIDYPLLVWFHPFSMPVPSRQFNTPKGG